MSYSQCHICRDWSWDVSKIIGKGIELCLPCYVDVLEVRQARRDAMRVKLEGAGSGRETERVQGPSRERPAKSVLPDLFPQIEMFD